jgi:N-acetylglucosamine-6-phosphate deacetylase
MLRIERKDMNMTGFIDLHTHGLGKFDTKNTRPESILKMAMVHAQAGTTTILPTIYPDSPDKMRSDMEAVRTAMGMQKAGVGELSTIAGVHLEGPFLNPLWCGALEKSSFLKPSVSNLKRLIDGYEDIIRIITIAPELPGALGIIEKCVSLGIRVNMGHSDATYQKALDGKKAGARGITHLFNTMRPFHHREPGLIGLGLLDEDIYIEVIADRVHIDEVALKVIFQIKRLDRIVLVSDSVKGKKDRKGRIYAKPGVLAGSSITLADAVENIKKIGITEAVALETAIDNPGRYLRKI